MALTKVSFSMINGAAVSVGDYIPAGTVTSTTDCSSYFTNALNALIAQGGGSFWIPFGTYKVNLDWSSQVIAGGYARITFMGNNSTLIGVTGATAVLTINRGGSGDNYIYSNFEFRNITFQTELNVCSGTTPVISYAVQILRSSADFYTCLFEGGSIASYYGLNSQYAKFIDCQFSCGTIYGCFIQSRYTGETVADQMTFDRCVFSSSQNGLFIQGCQQLRVMNSRVQQCFAGTGALGGIVIENYLDGAGSEEILLLSIHFEANAVRDIYLPSATSRTLIQSCLFSNQIGYITGFLANVDQTSTNCSYINNDFRTSSGPKIALTGNSPTLTYIGNDKNPYSLDTSGASNPQAILQKTGSIDFQYTQLNIAGYYGAPGLYFANPVSGGTWLWVSTSGVLRIKSGSSPTSDGDGVAVGSQS